MQKLIFAKSKNCSEISAVTLFRIFSRFLQISFIVFFTPPYSTYDQDKNPRSTYTESALYLTPPGDPIPSNPFIPKKSCHGLDPSSSDFESLCYVRYMYALASPESGGLMYTKAFVYALR